MIRKMIWKTISRLLLVVLIGTTFGCPQDSPTTLPPATEGGGFLIETFVANPNPVPTAGVEISGSWLKDLPGAGGDPSPIQGAAGLSSFIPAGLISLPGRRAPARWRLTWISGGNPLCGAPPVVPVDDNIFTNELYGFFCVIYPQGTASVASGSTFTFNPTPIYAYAPPSSGTITGKGFSYSYGMPLVQYYSMTGTLVGQENATYVAPDGTSMKIPGFNMSTLRAGTYVGFVNNAGPNGTWKDVGSAAVFVNNPGATIVGREQVNDYGQVYVTVNGFTKTVNYGSVDTPSTLLSNITTAFNSDSTSPIHMTAFSDALMLHHNSAVATSPTIAPNSQSWAYPPLPEMASFLAIPFEATTGTGSLTIVGKEQSNGGGYDSGEVSIAVNGFPLSTFYGGGDTASIVAARIAAATNANPVFPVTASAPPECYCDSSLLTLTSKSGSTGPLMIWATSENTGYPVFYGVPSFVPIPSQSVTGAGSLTIVGNERGLGNQADFGGVSVTLNGFTKTIRYSYDTPSTVASSLASALNSDSASPVTASATGSLLSLTSKSGPTSKLTISSSSQSYAWNPPKPGVASFVAIPSAGQ